MKKELQTAITSWVSALIILVIGILCIVCENATNGYNETSNAISYILGISLIIVSSLGIGLNLYVFKKALVPPVIINGLILALGILIVDLKIATNLFYLIMNYASYVMLIIGIIGLADAIILLVINNKNNVDSNSYLTKVLIEGLISITAIILGILALPRVSVISKRLTILGILLIIYALAEVTLGVLAYNASKDNIKNDNVIDVNNEE